MKYQYTGDGPVVVPDLGRGMDKPVLPGEVFESDLVINNATFLNLDSGEPAAVVTVESTPAPEPVSEAPSAPQTPVEANPNPMPEQAE